MYDIVSMKETGGSDNADIQLEPPNDYGFDNAEDSGDENIKSFS